MTGFLSLLVIRCQPRIYREPEPVSYGSQPRHVKR